MTEERDAMQDAAKPLRTDADRNRKAILAAAERLFAERGFDVPLSEIATAAGVGRATLHRNFATRTDLAFALFERGMQHIRDLASAQKGDAGDFEELFDQKLSSYVRNGGLAEAVQKELASTDFASEKEEIAAILHRAAKRASKKGTLRPDCSSEMFLILQQAMGGVMLSGGTREDRLRRAKIFKTLVMDGLRRR